MATQEINADESESDEVEAKFGIRHTLKQIRRDATARFGLYVLGFVLTITIITTIDTSLSFLTMGRFENFTIAEALPVIQNPESLPPPTELSSWDRPAWYPSGSWEHPLGTDHQGRDYLSRLIYGTRVSMMVAIFATLFGAGGGTLVGAVAGYYGDWVDEFLMRIMEMIYAVPPLILVIVFTVFVSQNNPDIQYAVIGVGISTTPVFARIIRSRVLSIREMEYIEAAKAAGVKDRNIILRHVIPNSFAPVVVYASLYAGTAILIVAGLSFLGYGAQPPTPDWGMMISRAHRSQMHQNPIASIWPGMAIVITVLGFNLLGDGLQDALDPRIEN